MLCVGAIHVHDAHLLLDEPSRGLVLAFGRVLFVRWYLFCLRELRVRSVSAYVTCVYE